MAETLRADVVIVGSGVAGSLTAAKLAARGLKVLILEAGPRIDRGDALERFYANPIKVPEAPYPDSAHTPFPRTHLPNGYFVQAGPDTWKSTYLRVAGGTTWHWLGRTPRFLPEDFALRARFGVGVDWPISYDELEPWYGKAEDELGVAGDSTDDHGSPRSTPYPMPAVPMTWSDRVVAKALAAKGGPRVTDFPHARNTVERAGRSPCCGSASCVPICPIQAKYDATVHLDAAIAAGARLVTDAVAHRVVVAKDGTVTAVRFLRPDRSQGEAVGKIFVLAANAIETPKLLLMSASDTAPGGVANRSGQVGRNLMDHVSQVSLGLSPEPLWQYRGPKATATVEIGRSGPERAKRASFDISLGNDGWDWGGDSIAATAARLAKGIEDPAALDRALADEVSRQLRVSSDVEMLPNPENRVTPDPEARDALGLPRPRVAFTVGEYERAGMEAAKVAHAGILEAVGCAQIRHADTYYGAGHLIGTYRMGADPRTSVVTPGLRAHDHPNLFLLGAGVFPTCGSANPTLTITALTLRAMDGIAAAARG